MWILRLAYRSGVTTAITAPSGQGFMLGLSTAFAMGASDGIENGAVIQAETALHVRVMRGLPVSVSTQIATLRRLLFGHSGEDAWQRVRDVSFPSFFFCCCC